MATLAAGYVPDASLDGLFADPILAADAVAFYLRHVREAGEVLDIGAGTGRLAIPLPEQEIPVCCLEPAPPMREALSDKLVERPHLRPWITIRGLDVTSFAGSRSYRLACMAGVWHQLPGDGARRAVLVAIARALAPGGLLILEDPHADRPSRPEPVVPRAERHIAEECYRLSFGCEPVAANTLRDTFSCAVLRRGRVQRRIEIQTLAHSTPRARTAMLLRQAGFVVEATYGGYDGRPATAQATGVLLLARMPPPRHA